MQLLVSLECLLQGFQQIPEEVPSPEGLLGGPWDLLTTCNWADNPTYSPPQWAYRGFMNYKYGYNPS